MGSQRWPDIQSGHHTMRLIILLFAITLAYAKEEIPEQCTSERQIGGCCNTGCDRAEDGASCFPRNMTKWGFDCVKSKKMCFPWSPKTDCHCCAKSCHNVGCKEFFNGRGTCMKFEAEKDMKEALDRGCVVSNKLCRRSKLAEMVTTQTSCQWSDWYDRDNPSGHGDYETHARFGSTIQTVGPGKQCEVSEYRVRIRGTTTEYSDVNSLPPHSPTGIPYVFLSSPWVRCNNIDQTWQKNCGPSHKGYQICCPDLEVKYCCKRKEVPQPKPCSCMCCPCRGRRCAEEIEGSPIHELNPFNG